MATLTLGDRKGNTAMTDTALLAQHDLRHAHGIPAFLWDKDGIVAIGAIQNLRMRFMRKYDIRHTALHLHDDLQVHGHGLL